MEKTAMQKFVDELERYDILDPFGDRAWIYNNLKDKAIQEEPKQIIDSYNDANNLNEIGVNFNGSDYYGTAFNNK